MYGTDPSVTPLSESSSSPKYKVRPDDFDFSGHNSPLSSTFGKTEVEMSAGRLIQFFQSRGFWCEFTIDELRRFYELKGWNYNAVFAGLVGAWFDDGGLAMAWVPVRQVYICFDFNGKCSVTAEFVERCAQNLKKKAA